MTQTPNNNDIKLENALVMFGNAMARLKELPDNSVDSIVTDPPYGLSDNKYVADTIAKWINGDRDFIPDGKGFMGKQWDSFVPPPAIWDECLRVLKPGGHLLAFFGSRTQDVGALSIRLAGFEIRDSVAWLYGSGFPKSMDISKAIDKSDAGKIRLQRDLQFTSWMRKSGLSASKARDILFASGLITEKSNQASHYFAETEGSQPAVPTEEMFSKLRPYLPEVPEYIEAMIAERTIESENFKKREVIGTDTKARSTSGNSALPTVGGETVYKEWEITAPSTDAAKQWQGWGTALKPAHEPIVVARKPLSESTVANNVLLWGTGGLNIDASRVGNETKINSNGNRTMFGGNSFEPSKTQIEKSEIKNYGRFPANLILSHSEDCQDTGETITESWSATGLQSPKSISLSGGADGSLNKSVSSGSASTPVYRCVPGCPVAELDRQAPSTGASRFFYVAKASKKDRNEGLDELEPTKLTGRDEGQDDRAVPYKTRTKITQNIHPTVKPTALMEYLVKLVTPEGGTVLDPFTGSGSTGKAALLNGFKFIGCELTEDYLPIITGRLTWAQANREAYQAEKVAAAIKASKATQKTPQKPVGGSLTALDAAQVALQQIAAKKANKTDNQLPLFDEVED